MEIRHFRWLAENKAKYNLGSSGMIPLLRGEVESLGKPSDIHDVLAEVYGVEKGNILLTHGTQESNFAVLAALRGRVGRVVTVLPEYEPIRVLPGFLNIKQVEVSIMDGLGGVLGMLGKGDLLFMSNPNNPLGVHFSRSELGELSQEAQRRGFYVVLDTIFLEFVESNLKSLPLGNMVYTSSTSKFYTAWFKLGWVIADRDIVREAGGVLDLVSPGVLEMEADYASILISHRDWVRGRNIGIIRPNVETLVKGLGDMKDFVNIYYSRDMPIAYVATKCGIDSMTLAKELLRRGVLVVPGELFGINNGMRIGLGSIDTESTAAAVKIIRDTVVNLCSQESKRPVSG